MKQFILSVPTGAALTIDGVQVVATKTTERFTNYEVNTPPGANLNFRSGPDGAVSLTAVPAGYVLREDDEPRRLHTLRLDLHADSLSELKECLTEIQRELSLGWSGQASRSSYGRDWSGDHNIEPSLDHLGSYYALRSQKLTRNAIN